MVEKRDITGFVCEHFDLKDRESQYVYDEDNTGAEDDQNLAEIFIRTQRIQKPKNSQGAENDKQHLQYKVIYFISQVVHNDDPSLTMFT